MFKSITTAAKLVPNYGCSFKTKITSKEMNHILHRQSYSKPDWNQLHDNVKKSPQETKKFSFNIKISNSAVTVKFFHEINKDLKEFFTSSFGGYLKQNLKINTGSPILQCNKSSSTVDLISKTQSNTTHPFNSQGNLNDVNLLNNHLSKTQFRLGDLCDKGIHVRKIQITDGMPVMSKTVSKNISQLFNNHPTVFKQINSRPFCSDKKPGVEERKVENVVVPLTNKQKLKNAIKDYGIVIVVFHITISLISLGCCYVAVSSGLLQSGVLQNWGIDEGATTAGVAAVFIVAYAIHKALAPWRIGITLTAVPFAVKKLRKMGYLKPPKPT